MSLEDVEAAVVSSGFEIVERRSDDPFGSWYLIVQDEPRLRLTFDGRDGWLRLEWETDRRWGDLREWDPLWIGKSEQDLSVPVVMRMLGSAHDFAAAAAARRG